MGRIETIKIPKELHPTGERILKIMHDDEKEPPKNYIWEKGGEYFRWDGKNWTAYEFEIIKDNGCSKKCACSTDEEMDAKFAKFKKDLLSAVIKMTKSQETIDVSDIRAQLSELRVLVHNLEEFENYYTKTEVDQKTNELSALTTALNGNLSGLSRRVSGIETNLSDILSTINGMNDINFSQFITSRDVSE